ncbi:class I SAM-dependent methyltransferase [Shewanella pneumatophori]|uniref:Methyltransferase domain-containing protein n=1 Tax=Shewanella pneumatophori TaxID=314092 RepID=A0A9X1ZD72_9GAMM|nr:methyltransferase domain-containing protein [Shewanella pneumatophori]MCL1140079.1 methyltransferase domain-containing protein [Shewanella pneumatophori]
MNNAPLITQFDKLLDKIPSHFRVLDLACGSGRNGAWFTNNGCAVTYLDQDLSRLELSTPANIELLEWNLEDGSAPELAKNQYDIVLVFNYLHRPLFPQIIEAIKPGGYIIYETFTAKQAEIGRPRNPNFLLKTGELKAIFANWHCLHYAEDLFGELPSASYKAQLIAQKPKA